MAHSVDLTLWPARQSTQDDVVVVVVVLVVAWRLLEVCWFRQKCLNIKVWPFVLTKLHIRRQAGPGLNWMVRRTKFDLGNPKQRTHFDWWGKSWAYVGIIMASYHFCKAICLKKAFPSLESTIREPGCQLTCMFCVKFNFTFNTKKLTLTYNIYMLIMLA